MATNQLSSKNEIEITNKDVLQKLIELFGNTVDLEIIQSIAYNSNYNTDTACNILLEMTSNTGTIPKKRKEKKTNRNYKERNEMSVCSNQSRNDAAFSNHNQTNRHVTTNAHLKGTSPKKVTNVSHFKFTKEQHLTRVITQIRQGWRVLILMRGLPGSGKSYLARHILDEGLGDSNYHKFILSTDDYFNDKKTGVYKYDPRKLQEAHEINQKRACSSMSRGISPVIIDNTNTQMWEMRSYASMAVNFGYSIEIVEPLTSWIFNEKELTYRNIHGVPRVKIKDMLERYEKNITANKIRYTYNLSYSAHCQPPLYRNYPPTLKSSFNKPYDDNSLNSNMTNKINEIQNLMKFDNVSVAHEVKMINRNEQIQSNEGYAVDNLLMCTQKSANDILLPTVKNVDKQSNLISTTTESEFSVEPEKKKFCNNSLEENVQFTINDTNESKIDSYKQANKIKNRYPNLNLSSWELPENVTNSWESWDIVSPLDCGKVDDAVDVQQGTNFIASPIVHTADSTTNTSASDFAISTNTDFSNREVKILEARNRDIQTTDNIKQPVSPPKKTLLDKSSMTDEEELITNVSTECRSIWDKEMVEFKSLFPHVPTDYLWHVYENCKHDINWAVDLLCDDVKEILPFSKETIETTEESNGDYSNNSVEIQQDNEINNVEYQINLKKLQVSKDDINEYPLLGDASNVDKFEIDSTHKIRNDASCSQLGESFSSNIDSSANDLDGLKDLELEEYELNMDESNEDEEMIEINLGDTCVAQLKAIFGFPEMFPQGYLPVVQIPIWLAGQLHAFYVESILGQMEAQNQILEMILKEDEELAKKLQMQEESLQPKKLQKTPNLKEIMDEQIAMNFNNKQIKEWIKLTPDTLAAKLTLQKLSSLFPAIDSSILKEILHAHKNNYKETVNILVASTSKDKIFDPHGTIFEPPITETVLLEMKEAEEERKKSSDMFDSPRTACQYRDEANIKLQKHNEYILKANKAYQRKEYLVAQYYSSVARDFTQLYERMNNLAATAFLEEHSQKLQKFHTLDLHYLYVKEAISALDMFLDKNIRLLEGSSQKTENLFIITGRGKRSGQGKPRLKPAIIARLRKRKIWFYEMNPGLLKIKIRPNSLTTNNIE